MSERLHRRLRALESVSPATRVLPLIRATSPADAASQRAQLDAEGRTRAGELVPVIILNVADSAPPLSN